MTSKIKYGLMLVPILVGAMAANAFAAADSAVVSLATSTATSVKDTALGVIIVVVPLAVAVVLARKALPWVLRFIR